MHILTLVDQYRQNVRNNRTKRDIFNHASGEMVELEDEINNGSTGVDGVVGEAIDVIACMVDLIIEEEPDLTPEQFDCILASKLQKWVNRYSSSIVRGDLP